jgi:hypothetical protein
MSDEEKNPSPETTPPQGVPPRTEVTEISTQVRVFAPADYSQSPFLYANFVQGSHTPHDVTLHFADYMTIMPPEPPEGTVDIRARPLVSVALPVNLVRSVIAILEQQVENWEGNFGSKSDDAAQDTDA